jgi:hypothetical protein
MRARVASSLLAGDTAFNPSSACLRRPLLPQGEKGRRVQSTWNRYNRRMIGSGMPSIQRKMPFIEAS